MKRKLLSCLFFILVFSSCERSSQGLPEITEEHIQQEQAIESLIQEEINKGELVEALESEGELTQKGLVTSYLLKKLISYIMPDHLEFFDKNHSGLNEETEPFAEYKGIYGRCHQFRIFYPYKDSRVENVKWASSILSVPTKNNNNTHAGVVLAPTLDGFIPFIENGLWLKLCRKGLASLMPESLFMQNEKGWQKIHFDPTPTYKTVDEYGLYEQSIVRYENILNKNLEIMRSINTLKTDRNPQMSNLNVMNVDPKRIGFWGSSFGAVVGALVVAKDPNIKGAVLTVGGGDLPYVIARSHIALFKKTRSAQMDLLGIKKIEEYQKFISQYIESDPLFFAKKTDSSRVHMILAKKDTSVPTQSQYELYEQFGKPSSVRLNSGHVLALLFMSWFNSSPSQTAVETLIEKLSDSPQE